eukprot:14535188-Alexandrium_andersonii.AAC.1
MCIRDSTCFGRSEPELRGRKSGLNIGPGSSRDVHYAYAFAQIPNLHTNTGIEGVRGRTVPNPQAPHPRRSDPLSELLRHWCLRAH